MISEVISTGRTMFLWVTKLDENPEKTPIEDLFRSGEVDKKLDAIATLTGVNRSSVFPVMNVCIGGSFEEGDGPIREYLLLEALRRVVDQAITYQSSPTTLPQNGAAADAPATGAEAQIAEAATPKPTMDGVRHRSTPTSSTDC
eukprot:TRINITY_DN19499_c0_g1_i1.p1 TRINITY_DN19499_c0_g1~~TRINITY_DN19499_c0_g1_i1.p1  ORF type:complete len:144 (-),score=35.66 TRINITY_DN19499_c0_g1_i1:65-496(-)